MCKHVSMRRSRRTRDPHSVSTFTVLRLIVLRQDLSLKLTPNNFGGLASQPQAPGTLQSLFCRWRTTVNTITPGVHMGSGHPNLSPHVSTTAFHQPSRLLSPKYRLVKALIFAILISTPRIDSKNLLY